MIRERSDEATQRAARDIFLRAVAAFERGRQVDRAFNELNRQKEFQRGKTEDQILDTGLPQIYEYLGKTCTRISLFDQAMDNFLYLRHLEPYDVDHWETIASLYITAGWHEQAAVNLIGALYLDPGRNYLWKTLEQEIAAQNQAGGPPAIIPGPDGAPRLDRSRPIVQGLLASAYMQMVRVFLEAKQFEPAERIRRAAIQEAGYSETMFDEMYKQLKPDAAAAATSPAAAG